MEQEQKPHRFDELARKIAGPVLAAIRTTLGVFSSPDKERWPTVRLLDYLKGAEEMAREMLREIAEKITIFPGKARAVSAEAPTPPERSKDRAPCFLLGVISKETPLGVWGEEEQTFITCHPGREAIRDPETQALSPEQLGLGSAPFGHGRDDKVESSFTRRLAALEDVLQHPGKHAARMARALYRAAHDTTGRLIAKSEEDLLLDRMNHMIDAHERKDAVEFARLHKLVLEPG